MGAAPVVGNAAASGVELPGAGDPSDAPDVETGGDDPPGGDGASIGQVEAAGPGRVVRAAIVAAVILPIVVAVARALNHHWFPIGDDALYYVRARDVLTSHHPLLGSWSSASLSIGVDVNHPGPLYLDLLAPFAKVFSAGPGAAIGVGTINAAAIVGASAAARYVGGWTMQRWVLLACAALSWTMGSELLYDLWQAHSPLLPFLCLLVLLIGITVGKRACLPWAMFVASLLLQTHLGYAYVLATAAVIVAALAWWNLRPVSFASIGRGLRSRTALVTAGVFLLCWIQPIIEIFTADGQGNLVRLATHPDGGSLQVGVRNATKLVAAVVALPPWWLRSGFLTSAPTTQLTQTPTGPQLILHSGPRAVVALLALAVLIGILVGLAVHLRQLGERLVASACAFVAASVAVAVACIAKLTVGAVGLAAHHMRWLTTLSVLVQVVLAWAIVTVVAHHLRRAMLPRLITPAVLALTAALTVANVPYSLQAEGPVYFEDAMPALRVVFQHLTPLRAVQPVLYRTDNLHLFEPYSGAVMMRLQELGIEFRVSEPGWVRQLGDGRKANGHEVATIFQLQGSEALLYDGGGCALVVASALGPGEASDAQADANVLAQALTSGSITVADGAAAGGRQDLLTAATEGDLDAAEHLVLEGDLTAWIAAGTAEVPQSVRGALLASTSDALHGSLDRINRWASSAFGIFVEQPEVCTAG